MTSSSATPSPNLLGHLRLELMRAPPFAHMLAAHVDSFITASTQAYFAPGEQVLAPADGPVRYLHFVRRGSIQGWRGSQTSTEVVSVDNGDLFPISAALAERAVSATYKAATDTFCLLLPVAQMHRLAADSAPFSDFLNRRVMSYLEQSRRALQTSQAMQALTEQSLETPLSSLMRGLPVTVPRHTPLEQALTVMHQRRIGSVLVDDDAGAVLGILTRHDILGRVTLARRPLSTPIEQVMSTPLHTLDAGATAHEAALLMSVHGIRHVPVTEGGQVRGLVSERDLFALQQLSLGQVSTTLRSARDVAGLKAGAKDIRRLAARLLAQGVAGRQLTELISHLNDVLTERLVQLVARQRGLDLQQACWLAFGSEGRGEQTMATDQDNGLVFVSDDASRDRPAWLAFALEVNQALDDCGYPLCKGQVMASNPACCLTAAEWCGRFVRWIEQGTPDDLLKASIYFDFRALAGQAALTQPMRALITERAAKVPRFIKQMAEIALQRQVPLDWLGGVATMTVDGLAVLDLKLQGTAIFVDAARLYALAFGIAATGTRQRLLAMAPLLKVETRESEGWCSAFEFLQMLRLQTQLQPPQIAGTGVAPSNPNAVEPARLNDVDRRLLKECLRVMRRLQQRMALDYQR